MPSQELLKELDAVYRVLEEKQTRLARVLIRQGFNAETGWYNGHYHKNGAGEWHRESYPIPVIGIRGLCDIEIQFDKVAVSAKLKRETALAYSFERFYGHEYEAYGVEDFLADFRHEGQTVEEMKENIAASGESEIGFSFAFPFEMEEQQMAEFAALLKEERFYY